MRSHKKLSIEKDYKLTPWNYEDSQDLKHKQNERTMPKTASHFFRRRNPSEIQKNQLYFQIYKQKKEFKLFQKQEREKPLRAKTVNVTFDSQRNLKLLTTQRLKKDLQNFATLITSRSHSKNIASVRLKNMSKSKTTKQLRPPFMNFSQRNSQVTQFTRPSLKKQVIIRSHNNFFQSTIQRTKSKNKEEQSKAEKLLFSLRRKVIKDNDLRILIKNTQSTLLKGQT